MIERGEKGISLDTLLQMSRVLNVSMDYLLLGSIAQTLDNPFVETLESLSPRQREDAEQILRLYAKACIGSM